MTNAVDIIRNLNESYANILGVAINFIVITTTVTIGLIQLVAMKKARYADVLMNVFDSIHQLAACQNRDDFFKLDISNYSMISYKDRLLVENIIDTFNKIAYMSYKRLLPAVHICEMYSGLFIKCFNHANTYIICKRKESGLLNYGIYLEHFCKICLRYRKRNKLGVVFKLDRTK